MLNSDLRLASASPPLPLVLRPGIADRLPLHVRNRVRFPARCARASAAPSDAAAPVRLRDLPTFGYSDSGLPEHRHERPAPAASRTVTRRRTSARRFAAGDHSRRPSPRRQTISACSMPARRAASRQRARIAKALLSAPVLPQFEFRLSTLSGHSLSATATARSPPPAIG
jgi:hypothetical protein